MAALFALYSDPLFWLFPIGSIVIGMVAFAAFAFPLTWLAARDPAWARPYRIQHRRPRAQDLVQPSVRAWLINNACMVLSVTLAWPLLRHAGIKTGPLPPGWLIAAQVLLFIYLDDFLFYWMHRAFHSPRLYKRIHSWHHRILTPWAITGHYMHPLEYVAIGSLAMVGPVLLQAHVVTLWVWVIFRQWEAAEGHCGYEFPWTPTHLVPGNDGAVHHDFHHLRVRGNYAGFLALVDGACGTYARGYDEGLLQRHRWRRWFGSAPASDTGTR